MSRCGFPTVGSNQRKIGPEQFHESAEADITHMLSLRKRVHAKPNHRGTSEALAWDDLTGMRLEAGHVIEAREQRWSMVGR